MTELATNFSEKMIIKINEVLKFVLENEHSDFYRKKYGKADFYPIKSYEDFQKIPFLEKEEFSSLPMEKRLFVPEDEVVRYTFSSGTTGGGKPTITPRLSYSFGNPRGTDEEQLLSLGVKKLLVFHSPLSGSFVNNLKAPFKKIAVVPGDITRPDLTASIAKEIGVQGINTTPTALYFFSKKLENIGFDFSQIKFISLGGEFCSQQKYQFFKDRFPCAFFKFRYRNSTVGPSGMGYRCDTLEKKTPHIFHPSENSLLEIIAGDMPAPPGEVGEIVQTHLAREAFPLIRYKTKDIGSLEKRTCGCGNEKFLTLGGKADFDVLKFSGITLTTERLAVSLESSLDYVEPFFQAHIFEKKIGEELKPEIELHLKPKEKFKARENDGYFIENLTRSISSSLRLSASNSLKDLVEKEVFLPLKIVLVDEWPEKEAKTKSIISHLN